MAFIKVNRKQFLLAGSLAAAVAAVTVTACGGSGTAPAQGSAAGQWTKAEISQFTAAGGSGGSASQDSCIIGYFERDMSFGNAMAVVSVVPASDSSMSPAQIEAALVKKYGTAEGDAIYAQYGRVGTDASSNCNGAAAAPSTAPAAASSPTSESSCTVDCTDPVASGESGWLAQVQAPLQNVQQDLSSISADSSGAQENLTMDGAQLGIDAQAALAEAVDPPPADDADWMTAMNDYVTASEDYTSDNVSSQDDNPAAASQEITAGNAALASFNSANGGVLNGIIQSS